MPDDLEIRFKVALIKGHPPDRIAEELARLGTPPERVAQLFKDNAALLEKSARFRLRRTRARLVGAAIFLPSMAMNIHYLFFSPGWHLFNFLYWATAAYGLMAMLLGQLDSFFGENTRDPD